MPCDQPALLPPKCRSCLGASFFLFLNFTLFVRCTCNTVPDLYIQDYPIWHCTALCCAVRWWRGEGFPDRGSRLWTVQYCPVLNRAVVFCKMMERRAVPGPDPNGGLRHAGRVEAARPALAPGVPPEDDVLLVLLASHGGTPLAPEQGQLDDHIVQLNEVVQGVSVPQACRVAKGEHKAQRRDAESLQRISASAIELWVGRRESESPAGRPSALLVINLTSNL